MLEFQSLHELQLFHDFIRGQVGKQTWRPKKVLLFLNPASGRGKAVGYYESTIANVLRLAGIVADVRITDKDGANSVKGSNIGLLLTSSISSHQLSYVIM